MSEQWEIEWKDYYTVLGVQPGATDEEIKAGWRDAAQAFHPDRYRTSSRKQWATKQFQQAQEAFEYLSDPAKRPAYDRARVNRDARGRAPHKAQATGSPNSPEGRTPKGKSGPSSERGHPLAGDGGSRSARLTRDYGYVRGELARIAVLAVVIFSAIGALAAVWR